MKHLTKSALIALLVFCTTTGSQAVPNSPNPNSTGPTVSGKLVASGDFAGNYEGAFIGSFFDEFYLSVYPNGAVTGYLRGHDVGASFTGTVSNTGVLSGSTWFRGKYYKVAGVVNKAAKTVVASVLPQRGGRALGILRGGLASPDYAPATGSRFDASSSVYGNGLSQSFTFSNNGTFSVYDSVTTQSASGTYSIAKVRKNLVRITFYSTGFVGGSQTVLAFFPGDNAGVAYNYSSGKFYYFRFVPSPAGRAPVDLGSAGSFVILAKSGISTTGTTAIVGDIGVSPIDSTAITGFGLILDSLNQFSRSSLVAGKVYAADYAVPTPTKMTTAVSDMQTAYTDAAGRTLPTATELGAGNINGRTLAPGLYRWGTGVIIPGSVTLSGGANDVWIFQIAQNLTVGNGAIVTLSGGAQAKNIFWQVAGQTTLGTTANFKGNILCKTLIALKTGATLNGRALAQTAVTLQGNAVVTTP